MAAPLFLSPGNRWSDIVGRLRRFFDLQAGSIRDDLAGVLLAAQEKFSISAAALSLIAACSTPRLVTEDGDVWPLGDASVDFNAQRLWSTYLNHPSSYARKGAVCSQAGPFRLTVPLARYAAN